MEHPCGKYNNKHAQDAAVIHTHFQKMLLLLGVLLLFTLPLLNLPTEWIILLDQIGITIIAALGLQLLSGYCGLISLGQAGFICVGAYTAAAIAVKLGWSFLITIPLAAIAAGIAGIVVGLPILRLRGFYPVIVTLAAGIIFPVLFSNYIPYLIPGSEMILRVPAASLGGRTLNSHTEMFYIIMGFMLPMIFLAKNIARTRLGRVFTAIRDGEVIDPVLGIDPARYKLMAFFICAAFAGVAGGLWTYWTRGLTPEQFSYAQSIWYFGIIIVGGMGTISGALVGSIILRGIDYTLTLHTAWIANVVPEVIKPGITGINSIILALVILVFLLFASRGIIGWGEKVKMFYRGWPFP